MCADVPQPCGTSADEQVSLNICAHLGFPCVCEDSNYENTKFSIMHMHETSPALAQMWRGSTRNHGQDRAIRYICSHAIMAAPKGMGGILRPEQQGQCSGTRSAGGDPYLGALPLVQQSGGEATLKTQRSQRGIAGGAFEKASVSQI